MMDGQEGLILLEGEAGVGKTRLLQEIAEDAKRRGVQMMGGKWKSPPLRPPGESPGKRLNPFADPHYRRDLAPSLADLALPAGR